MPLKTQSTYKLLFSFVFITQCMCAFGQTNWVKKDLGNNIYANFPTSPTYKLVNKAGTYSSKTDSCIFIAIIQYDVIPNYPEFVKLPADNQKKLIEILLDNTINGMFIQSANEGTPFQKISVGKYSGRQASFSAINPITGNNTTKYVKLFYALAKIYAFQCFAIKDNVTCIAEKNSFFKSISAN